LYQLAARPTANFAPVSSYCERLQELAIQLWECQPVSALSKPTRGALRDDLKAACSVCANQHVQVARLLQINFTKV
jgi:hypothetical protein